MRVACRHNTQRHFALSIIIISVPEHSTSLPTDQRAHVRGDSSLRRRFQVFSKVCRGARANLRGCRQIRLGKQLDRDHGPQGGGLSFSSALESAPYWLSRLSRWGCALSVCNIVRPHSNSLLCVLLLHSLTRSFAHRSFRVLHIAMCGRLSRGTSLPSVFLLLSPLQTRSARTQPAALSSPPFPTPTLWACDPLPQNLAKYFAPILLKYNMQGRAVASCRSDGECTNDVQTYLPNITVHQRLASAPCLPEPPSLPPGIHMRRGGGGKKERHEGRRTVCCRKEHDKNACSMATVSGHVTNTRDLFFSLLDVPFPSPPLPSYPPLLVLPIFTSPSLSLPCWRGGVTRALRVLRYSCIFPSPHLATVCVTQRHGRRPTSRPTFSRIWAVSAFRWMTP